MFTILHIIRKPLTTNQVILFSIWKVLCIFSILTLESIEYPHIICKLPQFSRCYAHFLCLFSVRIALRKGIKRRLHKLRMNSKEFCCISLRLSFHFIYIDALPVLHIGTLETVDLSVLDVFLVAFDCFCVPFAFYSFFFLLQCILFFRLKRLLDKSALKLFRSTTCVDCIMFDSESWFSIPTCRAEFCVFIAKSRSKKSSWHSANFIWRE